MCNRGPCTRSKQKQIKGIVDYGGVTWITFVHEVGHLLGAEHAETGVMEHDHSSSYGEEQFWDDNHKQIQDCLDTDGSQQCLY